LCALVLLGEARIRPLERRFPFGTSALPAAVVILRRGPARRKLFIVKCAPTLCCLSLYYCVLTLQSVHTESTYKHFHKVSPPLAASPIQTSHTAHNYLLCTLFFPVTFAQFLIELRSMSLRHDGFISHISRHDIVVVAAITPANSIPVTTTTTANSRRAFSSKFRNSLCKSIIAS